MKKIAVLLVNLGTPTSSKRKDVFTFLNEFLLDKRVMDVPFLVRQFLVRCVIAPFRSKTSSQLYQKIWTDEGSPLMLHSKMCQKKLQDALGDCFIVELAMRYRGPTIGAALQQLHKENLSDLIIVPLFPQYASATTGSVFQKVMEEIKHWNTFPRLKFINHFYQETPFLHAFCHKATTLDLKKYDHFLFSFHGLPERQLIKASPCSNCLKTSDCCATLTEKNHTCYSAQCYATAQSLLKIMNLSPEKCTVCFQSRLGKDPWMQPYTNEVIASLAERGIKNVLVFCPAFVCDCLETTYEIGMEYRDEFRHKGGENLDLYPGLNSDESFIEALKKLVLKETLSFSSDSFGPYEDLIEGSKAKKNIDHAVDPCCSKNIIDHIHIEDPQDSPI